MGPFQKAVRQNGDLWAYMLPRSQAGAHRLAEAVDSLVMLINTSNKARGAPRRAHQLKLDLR